jgi:hypothetical protein
VIRKLYTVAEDIVTELGAPVDHLTRRVAAAAVIDNPWAGLGRVDELAEEAARIAPALARELAARLRGLLGGVDEVEAFGKAAIVGLGGELEHGAALIHTPYFGNVLRELVDGSSIIVFSDDRGPAGTPLTVPIWHKTAAATRSHYQTIQVRVPDAPRDDELVVVAAAASGPRPNARIGDRTTDPAVRLEQLL